jgi:hypothetical protein
LEPVRARSTGERPVSGPPRSARMWLLSTTPADQSSRPRALSRLSNSRCSRSHTPAARQSRSRRDAVTPEQPISRGSSRHGTPVTSTKIDGPERDPVIDTRTPSPLMYAFGQQRFQHCPEPIIDMQRLGHATPSLQCSHHSQHRAPGSRSDGPLKPLLMRQAENDLQSTSHDVLAELRAGTDFFHCRPAPRVITGCCWFLRLSYTSDSGARLWIRSNVERTTTVRRAKRRLRRGRGSLSGAVRAAGLAFTRREARACKTASECAGSGGRRGARSVLRPRHVSSR